MTRTLLAASLVAFLASCGGGGSGPGESASLAEPPAAVATNAPAPAPEVAPVAPAAPTAPATETTSPAVMLPTALAKGATGIVFLGNSITQHGPSPTIGWSGNWGMAASAEDKGFVHLTAAALGLVPTVFHAANVERTGDLAALPTYAAAVSPTTVVVVELGDNSTDSAIFVPAYRALLAGLQPRLALACLGKWWANPARDAEIKAACEEAGGTFIAISDIYTAPNNPDRLETQFTNDGVAAHPHDWGMAQIAARLLAVLK